MTTETIAPILSIWCQLASFFFTMSGIFGDLLLIRFFLFLAYLMLFLNAVLGAPIWPNVYNPNEHSVDGLVWSVIGLYVHSSAVLSLLMDECRVQLTEDEAALWRMFYRTGGLSARLFKSLVAESVEIVEFQPGDVIPIEESFYILYTGEVKIDIFETKGPSSHSPTTNGAIIRESGMISSRVAESGEVFDLKHLGNILCGMKVLQTSDIICTSLTRTTLFRLKHEDMKRIAENQLAKNLWQSLLITQLSSVVEVECTSRMMMEAGGCHDRKKSYIFRPLEKWEEPKPFLAGSGSGLRHLISQMCHYMMESFYPPWLHFTGMRHTGLPAPNSMMPRTMDLVKDIPPTSVSNDGSDNTEWR